MTALNQTSDTLCAQIIELARGNPEVKLMWLYGSRANGTARATSDYDFAVAFDSRLENPLERRLRPELLTMDWQRVVKAADSVLSIVDINLAPLPLALNIIGDDSKLLVNKDELRYIRELNRIWGLWSDSQWQYDQQSITERKNQ
jgi:predicted nucleotidyltransferase